jgi:glycosyltransferase involved in cell wall biosynthesis
MNYVVVTPARNEEAVIGRTLDSMSAQTRPPLRWVVVDDGSTDQTAAIIASYAKRFPWIVLLQRPPRTERTFAGKVHAVNAGLAALSDLQFEVFVNLDSDVSFEPGYMEFLLQKFVDDPKLGVAGTPFTQEGGYDSTRDSFEGENYVAGPCQLFRYACWQDIGGYVPNPAGGVDWIAVMMARMKGWTVRAFAEKRFHHHRSMGTAERGQISALFSYGEKDYYLGGSPLWQAFRSLFRMTKRPLIAGGVALMLGYSWAALRRVNRPVSPELMRFHRREQMQKLRFVLASLARLKKPDAFRLATKGQSE